jgi:hypothetical protein
MSHFTLRSGKREIVVSVTCPHCRNRSVLSDLESTRLGRRAWVETTILYCSTACEDAHTTRLVFDVSQVFPIFAMKAMEDLWMLQRGVIPQKIAQCLQEGLSS